MTSKNVAALMDPAFDFISGKDGVTVDEIADAIQASPWLARLACRELRRVFAGSKENLVCEPQGGRLQWLYRFTGDAEKARYWISNRLNDTESRLTTIRDVAQSIMLATDARTIPGKKARKIHRTLQRLEEDLAEIVE